MTWETIPTVDLYSDGGAEPNPGQGGFGVIVSYKGIKKEFSQGFRLTTNNRMELMGVIYGLEQLKTKAIVNIYTDSRYVIDGITKGWADKWKSNRWYRTRTEKAVNYDLWERLLNLISNQQAVTFNWVKGHYGHPENERCDQLANLALNSDSLVDDTIYEENLYNSTGLEFTSTLPAFKGVNDFRLRKDHTKIRNQGDPCRKCGNEVIQKSSKKKEFKPGQAYYFLCPKCKTVYFVEEAKRLI